MVVSCHDRSGSSSRQTLAELVNKMQASDDWAATLEQNEWADAFAAGEEFDVFVGTEVGSVLAVLQDIGLVQ